MRTLNKVLQVIVVYRPPPSKTNKLTCKDFFNEFTTLLEHLTPSQGRAELLITGDFNFHIDDKNDLHANKFLQILHSSDLTQHVDTATHKKNHTLDLIITQSGDKLVSKISVSDPQLSDHYAVNCKLMITKPSYPKKPITYRNLKKIDSPI